MEATEVTHLVLALICLILFSLLFLRLLFRDETDEEYNKRIGSELKDKEAKERAQYEMLKKKFEK